MLPSSTKDILRKAAQPVQVAPSQSQLMDARTAARFLSGVARLIATEWDQHTMHEAFAEVWRCQFDSVPMPNAGELEKPVRTIGVIVAGLLPITGRANLMAALAFWAVESDPSEWLKLAS